MVNFKETLKTAGAIAALLAVGIEGVRFFYESHADIKASYLPAHFAIPDKLQAAGPMDTAAIQLKATATRFYDAYYKKLTPEEGRNRPDSMQRPRMPPSYFEAPVANFARSFRSFGTLHIENDGDKALSPVQVVHKQDLYYEYKGEKGKLQKGNSTGKFSIGELVAGESRDIKIWSGFPNGDDAVLTITYPDGKVVTSRAEQVDGLLAWLARYSQGFGIVILMLFGYVILMGVWYLVLKITQRRHIERTEQRAEE